MLNTDLLLKQEKDDLFYQLALWRMPGIGPIHFSKIASKIDAWSDLFTSHSPLRTKLSLNPKWYKYFLAPDWKGVEQDLKWAEQAQCHILINTQPYYPYLLKQISNPPPILFIKGDITCLSNPQIAIIGSRLASLNGLELARNFTQYLSKAGLTITSGLALGIDKACHEATLMNNGKTIAVLGNGLNVVYPKQHALLADKIVETGALVSEFPTGIQPMPSHFPRRNRIISGLSHGVLIVEAALKSGSLITAQYAIEQNREVFAIPGSIYNAQSKGCHALIKQGATLVEQPEDILEQLNFLTLNKKPTSYLKPNTNTISKNTTQFDELLMHCIDYDVTPIDVIIERRKLPSASITVGLLNLELNGLISRVPGGYVRLILTKVS